MIFPSGEDPGSLQMRCDNSGVLESAAGQASRRLERGVSCSLSWAPKASDRLIDQPWKIMSIARRDWANVGYSM
jgi:hypothetical protein